MQVLMTADTIGGVWTYALELTRALEPHGVAVALATMGAPLTVEQWRAAARCPNLLVFESRFRLEWMQEPWDDVARAGAWLLELEARVRPDVIHLNGYSHGILPWRAPVVVAAHSCVLSWWRAVYGQDAPPEWDRYRQAVTAGLRAADLVVAPSHAMLAAAQAHYGPFAATAVIANGRDPAAFAAGPKEPVILSAGRLWDPAKNVAALAQAALHVSWPIYVAGATQPPENQGGGAAPAGVYWLGSLSPASLARWYGRAGLYALPARYEPFGLSALEAALSGCALVLGDLPSLREVWADAACFVPPDDPAALADTLSALIAAAPRRAALAHRALRHARHYSPQRCAAGCLAAYRRLPARHRLPPAPSPAAAALVGPGLRTSPLAASG